ncbi:MAG: alpha/beta fold hydrolase [Trueperaceae bacterium]|nr:alpha/beta fold hydrolase [Trueperaceae bacterium]
MISDVAARRADLTPERDALWWEGRWHTYAELNERAQRAAALLASMGVGKGDRVTIAAHNHIAHVDLILATAKLGFVYTPLNVRLSEAELRGLGEYLRPSVVLHDAEHAGLAGATAEGAAAASDTGRAAAAGTARANHAVEAASTTTRDVAAAALLDLAAFERAVSAGNASAGGAGAQGADALDAADLHAAPAPDLGPEDPQMILLTGGTTGLPKGAMLPYRQVCYNAVNTVFSWGLTDGDCVVQATPCYHAAVNVFLTPLFHLGGRTIMQSRFEPAEYLRLVEELGATILFLVPTMYGMLAADPSFGARDLSRVRWAISGGAACPEPVRHAFAARGISFRQGYGLTEAGVNCFAIEPSEAAKRPESVGKPLLHAEAVVRRADGSPCAPGEVGELTLRGPHVFSGYFERPAATAEVLKDGWLWTGDLATTDEDGFFSIAGRRKEMFISGGENVFPVEVERALYDHAAVAECAVLGVPDERWGEVGLAVVVLKPGAAATGDELREHLRTRVARYKVPKHIEIASSLPKSGAGKILKRELGQRFERAARGESGAAARQQAPRSLTVAVARPTRRDEVAESAIGYDRAGAGTPVLLIHGNFASHRWWRELLADPPPGLDLIAPDLPGFAHSDDFPEEWPAAEWVDAWADSLAAFLRGLGVVRAGVVGHSLGGAVAQTLAARHPGLVARLLLVDSAPPAGYVTPDEHYPALRAYRLDRAFLAAALAAIMPTRVPENMSDLVDDALAMGERHYEGNARALAAYDLSGRTAAVQVPVTVLHGSLDLLIGAAAAAATAAAYPNASLVTWQGVGHSPPLEAAAAFRELLAKTFSKGERMT